MKKHEKWIGTEDLSVQRGADFVCKVNFLFLCDDTREVLSSRMSFIYEDFFWMIVTKTKERDLLL